MEALGRFYICKECWVRVDIPEWVDDRMYIGYNKCNSCYAVEDVLDRGISSYRVFNPFPHKGIYEYKPYHNKKGA
jgi:uncharacterized protein YlaI